MPVPTPVLTLETVRAMDDDELRLRSDECEFGCGDKTKVDLVHAELRRRGLLVEVVE